MKKIAELNAIYDDTETMKTLVDRAKCRHDKGNMPDEVFNRILKSAESFSKDSAWLIANL